MKKSKNEFGIKSVEKAFLLLEHILSSPSGVSLTALAEKTALCASTARNLLRTMEKSFYVERTDGHLYKKGKAFAKFFHQEFFTEEEKTFLQECVEKISISCGETVCLFYKCKENIFPLCISSHSGSKGVIASEEASIYSINGASPAREMLLNCENGSKKEEFREGKACKNALWSICLPLADGEGKCIGVLALFLPVGRASKEKCNMLKEFLSVQKYSMALIHFFAGIS